eukprot:COSAG02_NODE_20635_length_821_cov_4.256233_1_plen_54_part_10
MYSSVTFTYSTIPFVGGGGGGGGGGRPFRPLSVLAAGARPAETGGRFGWRGRGI